MTMSLVHSSRKHLGLTGGQDVDTRSLGPTCDDLHRGCSFVTKAADDVFLPTSRGKEPPANEITRLVKPSPPRPTILVYRPRSCSPKRKLEIQSTSLSSRKPAVDAIFDFSTRPYSSVYSVWRKNGIVSRDARAQKQVVTCVNEVFGFLFSIYLAATLSRCACIIHTPSDGLPAVIGHV